MLDAVANTVTGPVIVHDEEDLEGALAFLVDGNGRCAVMRADGSLRTLKRVLDDGILVAMSSTDTCPIVRMRGNRVASLGRIGLTTER